MERVIKHRGLLLLALVMSSLLSSSFLLKPSVVRAATNDAQGIQVSPVVINLNAEKGQVYNLKLTVTNVTANTLLLKSAVNDFSAKDETGNPQVILDQNATNGGYSLKSWVSPITPITLGAQQNQTVNFTISIPENAEPGGHYGVVRFSGLEPSAGDQNVSLTASVGVLILARVQGDVVEQLSVKEMFTAKSGKSTSMFSMGPVEIVSRIQNSGNVHVQPVGNIVVTDSFGKTVATLPVGSNSQNVLPGSIRRYETSFDKSWLFGRYTAKLSAAYGTTGGVLMGSTVFWVIPYKLIAFIAVTLFVIIWGGKRLIRRYNAHIIGKSHQPRKGR